MEEKLEKIFQNLIEDKNIEILYVDYESEGGYNYLRVYLEKVDGSKVNLDDCEKVSLAISDIADKEVKGAFMLEVSSPGIERKLKKAKDFIKYINQQVKIKTRSNILNSKNFEGKLLDFKNNIVFIDDNKLGLVEIPFEKIKLAKNIFDFSNYMKEEEN